MTTDVAPSDCSYAAPSAINLTGNVSLGPLDKGGLDVKFKYSSDCPPTTQQTGTTISCHPDLKAPLESFVRNTNYFSSQFGGYGPIHIIGHIGARRDTLRYSDGAVSPSFHYEGKALDISWVQWKDDDSSVYCLPCGSTNEAAVIRSKSHRRLVAVEAGLRKWFGYVLNRRIEGHADHFHVDNGCPLALRLRSGSDSWKHTSCHYFLQDCISAFTDVTVEYDGSWGDKSKQGYRCLLSDLGMECLDPVRYISHYMIFLDFIMMHGFGNVSAGMYRWGDNTISS